MRNTEHEGFQSLEADATGVGSECKPSRPSTRSVAVVTIAESPILVVDRVGTDHARMMLHVAQLLGVAQLIRWVPPLPGLVRDALRYSGLGHAICVPVGVAMAGRRDRTVQGLRSALQDAAGRGVAVFVAADARGRNALAWEGTLVQPSPGYSRFGSSGATLVHASRALDAV